MRSIQLRTLCGLASRFLSICLGSPSCYWSRCGPSQAALSASATSHSRKCLMAKANFEERLTPAFVSQPQLGCSGEIRWTRVQETIYDVALIDGLAGSATVYSHAPFVLLLCSLEPQLAQALGGSDRCDIPVSLVSASHLCL